MGSSGDWTLINLNGPGGLDDLIGLFVDLYGSLSGD
jgi:hypothetical protein